MENCLRLEGVAKAYAGVPALRGVSLEIGKGEVVALLGPNASGKTTLVKILVTLLGKDSGRVSLLGCDLDREEARFRERVGYVGQDSERSAYGRLTVRENLRFFAALRGMTKPGAKAATEALAASFGFEAELDKLFMSLSGGQKQTAVIIRALMAAPPLVVLDEPTKGLDPIMARRIRTFLRRYVRETGTTILLTSHALSEVDELSDRVALLRAGSILVEGPAEALKADTGWEGVLEIPDHLVTEAIDRALAGAGGRRKPGPLGWTAYGLAAGGGSFPAAMAVLADGGVERAYRYRPVSLEDAFEDRFGAVAEGFEP